MQLNSLTDSSHLRLSLSPHSHLPATSPPRHSLTLSLSLSAIEKMEKQGAKVFKAQKHIVEEILTMRCPRCKMAFADFTGCNALYCAYAGCGANFCALCFKDCGGGVSLARRTS